MKLFVLLAIIVTAEAKAAISSCEVSDWGEWSDWGRAKHDNSIKSFVRTEKKDVDQGRVNMEKLMAIREENRAHRQKCLSDGTCPELAPMQSEGYEACPDGEGILSTTGCPCKNINQEAYVSINELLNDLDANNEALDIWGWVDPLNFKEYAIIALDSGTSFVDIMNVNSPTVVGHLPTHSSNSGWRDVKTIGDYAYIVSEAWDHGIQVFDLKRLRSTPGGFTTFTEDAHYDLLSNCHNIIANEATNHVYAVGCTMGGNGCSGGLHAVDVSDPLNPTFAGCFGGDGYVHDAQCLIYDGPDPDYQDREICFCYNEDDFTIVDVTDKSAMTMVSSVTYGTSQYTHQGWATEDLRLVLLDDELDEKDVSDKYQKTYLWDVVDLDNPVLRNTYTAAFESIDHNQYIVGDLTYQANYRTGIRVLHIDQENFELSEHAYFDVYPSSDGAEFNGAWSIYPYFFRGHMAVSSIETGLYIITPDQDAIRESINQSKAVAESYRARYRTILQGDHIGQCPNLVEMEHA